jgi:hypothetical protein
MRVRELVSKLLELDQEMKVGICVAGTTYKFPTISVIEEKEMTYNTTMKHSCGKIQLIHLTYKNEKIVELW